MRESISYSKLRSGAWGVRVATKGRHPNPGDEVIVRKANGDSNRVTLGGIVDTDRGAFPGPAVYYAIARRNGNGRRDHGAKRGAQQDSYRAAQAKAKLIHEGQQYAKLVTVLEAQRADGADVEEALTIARASLDTLRAEYSRRYLGRAA